MFRMGTVIAAIGFIASMGGYEHEMFGLGGMFIRMAFFILMMIVCYVLADITEKRKRAKRVAARKARNKNTYYVITR